jgi:hypothetical protein
LGARFPAAWSGCGWSGGRKRLRSVGMRCKRLRVAGGAWWARCPTDVACEVIIAHGALLHLVDTRLKGFHGAGLGIGT